MTKRSNFQVRRADHVGFAVASLDESLSFWVDGLGARLMRTGEMGGDFLGQVTGAHGAQVRMAIVSLADQTIELLEYQGVDRPSASAKPHSSWKSPHMAGRHKARRSRSRVARGLEHG
jgi:catechol 2,3-dioxygenase-like lactoylglutathione lyase family enzyme